MKIGILTFHRAENYGALLQAYALRKYLSNQGLDVSFVDYWPQYHINHYKIFSIDTFKSRGKKGKIKYLLMFLIWGVPRWLRKHKLNKFSRHYFNLQHKAKYQTDSQVCSDFDIVIYGSDQIWRKHNLPGCPGFNFWYFGSDNIQSSKKISYAASMGIIDVSSEESVQIKAYLNNFDKLSVREVSLQRFLKNEGIMSDLVLDPVFLLDKSEWEDLSFKASAPQKHYLLFYNLLNTPESIIFAEKMSDMLKLPIVEINMILDFSHLGQRYIHSASVQRFLSLVRNADFVVSNSFHGVAFSIIFEKQFYALGIGNMAGRVISLLQLAGIEERYLTGNSEFPDKIEDLDFNKVRSNLESHISSSKQFLSDCIGYE